MVMPRFFFVAALIEVYIAQPLTPGSPSRPVIRCGRWAASIGAVSAMRKAYFNAQASSETFPGNGYATRAA